MNTNSIDGPPRFLLVREGIDVGRYTFEELVTMWEEKTVLASDRIIEPDRGKSLSVADVVHLLTKAGRSSERTLSRWNLAVGTVCLIVGAWIYQWATGNRFFIERYEQVVQFPVYRVSIMVSLLFAIVGIVKVIRSLQTK